MADDIIKTLIAEAYGEGPEGMRRVAETIINRAAIRGLSPEQVVQQAHQYTGLTQPGPAAKKAWADPQAIAAAQAAWELALQPGDPTGGADHYYAPGTIDEPYWAKSMTPKGSHGGHAFFSSRPVPPGEIPNVVASLTDTVQPRTPPSPVTPSPNLAAMRSMPRAMPQLPRPRPEPSRAGIGPANLGDSLAMSPVMGGQQRAPMFDAAYDTRVGAMQKVAPIDSQGIAVGASAAPPPFPAPVEDRVTARNRALTNNWAPAVRLPELPPSTLGQPPTTRVVQSVPMPPGVVSRNVTPAQELAMLYQNGGPTRPPTETQRLAALYAGGGPTRPPPIVSDRLMPSPAYPPANYGSFTPYQVAQIGVPVGPPSTNMAGVPLPRPRPGATQMAVTPPRVAPAPLMRPNFGMGGPDIIPRPIPAPPPAARTPPPAPRQVVPQGFTDTGNGRLVSNETGGVYYARHLR